MTKTALLLVEDDIGIGRMLERGLTTEGYDVDWVRDLRTGIEKIRSGAHQIVVLDRMLPDGDGSAFCSALRKFGSAIPVCMLTARDALEDKVSGFDAGADDYITKPFEFDELVVRLRALLRRAKPPIPKAFLDPVTRSFRIGSDQIRFTKREYPLFSYLLERHGQGVTREEILADAWGLDGEVTLNSVDVYIGYLRRKLTNATVDLRIETVRGIGFMLVAPEDVSVTVDTKE
ncbi:MAG: response regulator transcription factor [Pseudomonadota bacterium]